MANFADLLTKETSWSRTANGAVCLDKTGDALLDLYATIGALRSATLERKYKLFDAAVAEDAELAAKILFYARDVREGLGERNTFRELLAYAANNYSYIVTPNIPLIGFYGRYDDLYFLIGTPCEDQMWTYMKEQFTKDYMNMLDQKPCSLLAKWIKTPDASSPTTRRLGILTSQKLGFANVGAFKRKLKALRKYLDIVEIKISANEFDTIAYEKVPSNAMTKYRSLFAAKDNERFAQYLNDVTSGKAEIKANTLYPYDIVQKILRGERNDVLEAQWKALPNYVKEGDNILIMADVSGSMTCCNSLPMASSVGLAIYFAERATGVFHNKFMTFSSRPELVSLSGATLYQKVHNAENAEWRMNTDLAAAFRVILDTAVKNKVPASDIPKALVIISDMQIDYCTDNKETFYDMYAKKFAAAGYPMPNVIFWNVNSEHSAFHADKGARGVQYLSGHSATSFKALIEGLEMTPYQAMIKTITSERYDFVTIAK